MKIKIYRPYLGIDPEELVPIEVEINGKVVTYCIIRTEEGYPFPEQGFFACEPDNNFEKQFQNLKLNHRFTFHQSFPDDDSSLVGELGYAHLNFIKKTRINWIFKRHWLQKEDNIKWLIAIPIAIMTTLITIYLEKHFHLLSS